ncbi:hypothetical protein [Micromonospora sp. CPCC 206061]|uniref:hypothetical protein n=1 Tax=Micromonospora sp. CPCC 206061 TaxID=3122410 RepID=UPI002FEF93EC
MNIERTALPGVGVCHTATTTSRQHLGIISHVTGRRDLVLYDPDFVFHHGDTVVAVGDHDGVTALTDILTSNPI